jgi:hypothetical protein
MVITVVILLQKEKGTFELQRFLVSVWNDERMKEGTKERRNEGRKEGRKEGRNDGMNPE